MHFYERAFTVFALFFNALKSIHKCQRNLKLKIKDFDTDWC